MAQFSIDLSGRKGLAPRFWGDADRATGSPNKNLRYLVSDGQMVDGYFNPFRRYGYLSAASATFSDIDQVSAFTAIPNCVIYDDINDDIIVSDFGRYFKALMDGLDDRQFTTGSLVGDLGSTGTPKIYDLEIYNYLGTRNLFIAYEKSDNIYVDRIPLPYDSGTGSEIFNSAATVGLQRTLFMRVADNGFMYVFSDSALHLYDGATNTLSANTLIFPPYFTIQDAIDYRGFFFIAIDQSPITSDSSTNPSKVFNNPCGVYIWDRDPNHGATGYIPLYGARSVRKLYTTWTGDLRAMVINAEGVLEIRQYDGNSFNVLTEVGHNTHPNFHDSVTYVNGLTIWLGANADIFCHGSIVPGEAEGIYKIGKLSEAANKTGYVFFGGANDYSTVTGFKSFRSGLDVGYLNSTNVPKTKQWDMYGTGAGYPNGTTPLMLAGDVYTAATILPQMANVHYIMIYFAPGSSSGSSSTGTVSVYVNNSSSALMTKTVTRDELARGYKRIEINKSYVNTIQFSFSWPTDTSIVGNFDMSPFIGIVNYEPTNTKG